MSRIDELKAQIAQLDGLVAEGTLSGEAAHAARQKLEHELVAQVLQSAAPAPADAAPAPPATPTSTPLSTPAATPESVRPSRALMAGLAVFVVAFSLAGYAWLGNREGLAIGPGSVASAASAPPSAAQIEVLLERLAQRLKEQPDDAEGWAMLGRSYSLMGRFNEAVPAFQRVVALRPQDAQAHADYADALGSAKGGTLAGEPEQLIGKALQLDPKNLKALALSGSVAFSRGDAAGAVKHWEQALSLAEPDGDMARQLRGVIDEARQRAGMPPVAGVAGPTGTAPAASGPAAAPATATATAGSQALAAAPAAGAVQGRVTLSAALRSQAGPDDTVFVFARPAQGARMPLAILRKQVKDLPLDFTLDDSLAMSPAARISGAGQVIVGARISKSGNAMPQPGDLQALSAPVAVGTRGLQLEIGEALR